MQNKHPIIKRSVQILLLIICLFVSGKRLNAAQYPITWMYTSTVYCNVGDTLVFCFNAPTHIYINTNIIAWSATCYTTSTTSYPPFLHVVQAGDTIYNYTWVQAGMTYGGRICTCTCPCNYNTLGIKDAGQDVSWDVFPNPFNDDLHIVSPPKITGSVRIADLFGQTVLEIEPESGKTDLNVKALSSGVYFLVVSDEGKKIVLTRKVIKR